MNCTVCGNELHDGMFCPVCGTLIRQGGSEPVPASTAMPTQAFGASWNMDRMVVPQQVSYSPERETATDRGSAKWLILIPVVLILCLVSIFIVKKIADDHPKIIEQTYSKNCDESNVSVLSEYMTYDSEIHVSV